MIMGKGRSHGVKEMTRKQIQMLTGKTLGGEWDIVTWRDMKFEGGINQKKVFGTKKEIRKYWQEN